MVFLSNLLFNEYLKKQYVCVNTVSTISIIIIILLCVWWVFFPYSWVVSINWIDI